MNLKKFLKSNAGRKFYNFAYCWGACLVILGAVFKIAHMPFDSVLLMVGLFTEVFIFFISGFDTPDEIYEWEKVFPQLKKSGEGGKGTAQDAVELARKQYMQGLETMRERVDSLNRIYLEQEERMKAVSGSIDPGTMARMKEETARMTRLLEELNSRYSDMLDALGTKRGK
ncbi:MAG TPA: gliding motility protein GldL [Candidatus Coprenecus pullistercoris]|nr:gliding motility protein GldL [Candidatus Coprenecus pullistercoris]